MNPMSILTLPTSALREAYLHSDAPASRGERTERRSALMACLLVIMGAVLHALV